MPYKDKQKQKEYYAEYHSEHRDKRNKQNALYKVEHKQELEEQGKQYRLEHKEEIKAKKTKYRFDNIEEIRKYKAVYSFTNKDRIRTHRREYKKRRKLIDPSFKTKCYLRKRIWYAFNRMGLNKPCKTEELLGADFETVMRHIESQFIFGMSWENYGEWHIDHKKPLALAKTEKQLIKLCHYTNLQPLWAEENRRKQAKTDYKIKEVRFG